MTPHGSHSKNSLLILAVSHNADGKIRSYPSLDSQKHNTAKREKTQKPRHFCPLFSKALARIRHVHHRKAKWSKVNVSDRKGKSLKPPYWLPPPATRIIHNNANSCPRYAERATIWSMKIYWLLDFRAKRLQISYSTAFCDSGVMCKK